MKKTSSEGFSRKAGRAFVRARHGWLRQEGRFIAWATMKGISKIAAQVLLWVVKLVVLVVVLYVAFWITLVVGVFVALTFWMSGTDLELVNEERIKAENRWYEEDPKNSIFYHSFSSSDGPDPRFDDD